MEQLELFPKEDMVRFAMSFSPHEFGRLKTTRPEDYHRIREIRGIVNIHNAYVRQLKKRLAWDLERALS